MSTEQQKDRILALGNRLGVYVYRVPQDKRTTEYKAFHELNEEGFLEVVDTREFDDENVTLYHIRLTESGKEAYSKSQTKNSEE